MRKTSNLGDNPNRLTYILSLIFLAFGIGALVINPVSAENPTPTISPVFQALTRTPIKYPDKQTPTPVPTRFPNSPNDFLLIDADSGVQLFRKDYPNGSPDFVQVIDLSQGARIKLMHGQIVEPRPEKGIYGHSDPRMTSLPIQSYWQQVFAVEKRPFCVSNGLFFYMPEYPTRLAFPLKVDNEFVTDGFGFRTYLGQTLILELWEDHANIRELTKDTLNQSTAPNIIGGLSEQANKRAKNSVGRTFMGITDRDEDGNYETILLLNTKTALQTSAADVLRSFGAGKIMMLDGGGSTQLLCRNSHYISSDRPIPQAIAVIAAVPPPVSSKLLQKPLWPVLLEGENLLLNLVVQNTGIITWTPSSTQFYMETNALSGQTQPPVPREVNPGETVVFTQTLAAFTQKGVYPVRISWGIINDSKLYQGEPIEFHALVIPTTLGDKRIELEEKTRIWSKEQPEEVEQLAMKWLQSQENPTAVSIDTETLQESIRLNNIAIVPLLMLPVLIVLAALIGRMRG
jgi:hypothetical protein